MSLQTTLNPVLESVLNDTTGSFTGKLDPLKALTDGTTEGKANILYVARRTTVGSADSMDLNGGGLKQPNQAAFNAVDVAAVGVVNESTTAWLTFGGGSNPLANFSLKVPPGGRVAIGTTNAPAWAVIAGTGDLLNVAVGTGDATYRIVIVARDA